MSAPNRDWLTLAEVAEHLAFTERTVRNMIRRGDLRAYRVRGSRAVRIKAREVDAVLRPIPALGGGRVA